MLNANVKGPLNFSDKPVCTAKNVATSAEVVLRIVAGQNTQTQNTQSLKIPKIEIVILIKYLTAS